MIVILTKKTTRAKLTTSWFMYGTKPIDVSGNFGDHDWFKVNSRRQHGIKLPGLERA